MRQPAARLYRLFAMGSAILLAAACTETADVTSPDLAPSLAIVDGETCYGRMTGGGQSLTIDGVSVSKGLTLHCDILLSNNLNITWDGGHWHIQREELLYAICIDDPNFNPEPPPAPFDTFIGAAVGRLGNSDNSIAEFTFIDDGEPGTSDQAYITIYAPDQGPGQVAPGDEVIVLEVGGQIDTGNLQAHYDQPHGNGN